MEGVLLKLMEMQKNVPAPTATTSAGDATANGGTVIINGVNVMCIPPSDAYSYALNLMDLIFTKEDMALFLLFKSKKSDEPELDQTKV